MSDILEKAAAVCSLTGINTKEVLKQSITYMRRLGRPKEGWSYRPLLIQLRSSELRDQLIRCQEGVRKYNEENDTRYRIQADLTRDQMDNFKKLWEEADKKTKNGTRYYVTGPRENPVLKKRDMEDGEEEELERRRQERQTRSRKE